MDNELMRNRMTELARSKTERKAKAARRNGALGGRPRKPLPPDAARFFRAVLAPKRENVLLMAAWHWAGHMTMWRLLWPDEPAGHVILGGRAGIGDVDRMLSYRLAGVAGELVGTNMAGAAMEIGEAVARDWLSPRPQHDWAADERMGGDFPAAIQMLGRGRSTLGRALGNALGDCVALLQAHRRELSAHQMVMANLLEGRG